MVGASMAKKASDSWPPFSYFADMERTYTDGRRADCFTVLRS